MDVGVLRKIWSQENWPPIKVLINEHNTLPVVYNINSSTVTLSQHQNYNIYIYAHNIY